MTRHVIKKSEAKSEYGGWKPWFRKQLDLPEEVELSAKDAGSYSNVHVFLTFPDGEEIKLSGYFSGGISPHYKITTWSGKEEKIENKVAEMD